MEQQSNLITAGGEAVKKCLKLQILAPDGVFHSGKVERQVSDPTAARANTANIPALQFVVS